MIETYLQGIDALLSTSPLMRDVVIVRRAMRDTEFEKVVHYRYRVLLAHGDLIEMTERVLAAQGALAVTKYRHHWQDRHGRLLNRWDKAPHYSAIDTLPHHLHDGAEDSVVRHPAITGLEMLQYILEAVETQEER
mgnify:CR=1 FL=1